MTKFKFLPSVGRDYNTQIDCYAACANYKRQPEAVKEKIDALIAEVGGVYAPALKEYLTTSANFNYICTKHYISVQTLNSLRKKFYESW